MVTYLPLPEHVHFQPSLVPYPLPPSFLPQMLPPGALICLMLTLSFNLTHQPIQRHFHIGVAELQEPVDMEELGCYWLEGKWNILVRITSVRMNMT
jgi:hypothetical protein